MIYVIFYIFTYFLDYIGDDESVSDSDDEEDSKEVDEKKELEKIQELEKSGKLMSVKDLEDCSTEDEDQVTKDKNWKRFQKVVKCASDQVIRYQRTGNPLWISTNNVPGLSVVFSRDFVP